MQFLVVARDGTDPGAEARRRDARPAHAALVQAMKDDGRFVVGGHTLDDAGRIIGSAVIVAFPTYEAFNDYLQAEPYVAQGVWKHVEVTRINLG
jgi:uncharacterized protein